MNVIPVTVLDNFLPNPDLWVDLANSISYTKSNTGNWPGERSEPIEIIHPNAFRILCERFFSIFYKLEDENISWKVTARFQKITSSGEGWVHYDKDIISGIVYLSKNANPSSGTAIYTPKTLNTLLNTDKKMECIKNNNLDGNKEAREANNSNFEESIVVSNVFNRLVAFDSNIPHRARNYYSNDEGRLTLVFFIEKLLCESTPVYRSRKVLNV